MQKINDKKNMNNQIFFRGQKRSLSESGALLIKIIIEDEIASNNSDENCKSNYAHVADILGKSESAVRKWTYDWDSNAGHQIPILDFLKLGSITKSIQFVKFIKLIILNNSEEDYREFEDLVKSIGNELILTGTKIKKLTSQKI